MARNLVTIKQVVNDFLLTLSEDDYVSNVPDYHVYNLALRGAREMTFDIAQKVKALKLEVNTDLNTVELPDDYVDFVRIGAVGNDGLFYAFKENRNIDMSMAYVTDTAGNPIDSDSDGVYDRKNVKNVNPSVDYTENYIDARYLYDSMNGGWYGYGGAHSDSQFRINHDQNRIELPSNNGLEHVFVEYIADTALETNPCVHVYTEEALRQYIYMKIIERKASVPMMEKQRARAEYFNEFRRAKARLNSFSKEEALYTIRKNTKQSPKY